MASVDEVAASLGANKSEAEGLAGQIAASKQQTEELQSEISVLGAEGAANRASAAVQTIEGLMADAAGLAARIGEAQAQVLAIKQAGSLPTSGEASASVVTGPLRSDATSAPAYDPKVRDPDRAAAIRRFGWPKRSDGKTSVRGVLYDSAGKQVLHAPLQALKGNQIYNTPDLKDEYRTQEIATSWHVEGGAAAYMRATRTKEMSLWLNLPPCGYRGEYDPADPNGCHANLSKILPEGYTLRVHMEFENGGYRTRTFRGTGEGLKDG